MQLLWAAGGDTHWLVNVLFLLSVPALVALNGLFVAAEFALVAVRRTRVEQMVNEGVRGAKAVEFAVENLDRAIAATQLGITLASIALGFVGEPALARLFEPLFQGLPSTWQAVTAHGLAVGVAFFIITFLHVVFGELIPKTVALQIPDSTALWVARPLLWFAWGTRPLIKLMNGTGALILRLCGYRMRDGEQLVHSVEELGMLIEDTEEAGLLDADEAEILQNIFELSDKKVGDCMVPKERMAALELSTPPEAILESVRQGAHTRIPVYEGQLNNIVGIVNTKDLFYLFSLQGVVVLQDAIYPAIFLRPDEEMANALRLFKKSHRHMALVRDEEGVIHGLITLEDVLEEIVGDIEDEHDQPRPHRTHQSRLVRRRLSRRSAQGVKAPPKQPEKAVPRSQALPGNANREALPPGSEGA